MRRTLLGALTAVVVTAVAGAQAPHPTSGPEIRTFVGAFMPTGAQRDDFKDATLLGVQVARELSPYAHVLASASWTHGHNKFAALNDNLTYIWQYDVGGEVNALQQMSDDWFFRPFIGAGVGARTYDYKAASASTKTCSAGYASVGTEFQRYDGALRLDVRDYLNCFESPITAKKSTRNDIGISFGVVYHIR